ncbi:aldehyde dehydrogenase [Fistulina hepatica ATCC 64428]|uniref:Aldehyde dehydrogenase n=1 Tax=Fistulina hepatica ATCC 64428 TaxID=1128425 RepID=A0A0D7AAQ9_9AGAR|nr:aldehyde dehydrogenase [Fistulina hepatica ATCC 64428]
MAATLSYTSLEEIDQINAQLRTSFLSGLTKSLEYRKHQLLQFAYLLQDHTSRFESALAQDLGRPTLEADFLEILPCIGKCLHTYKNVEKWARPESAPFTLNFALARPKILKTPKGVVLIIGPFNYPLWSLVGPIASAIAAGNVVVFKPSERCPVMASLLTELIAKYMDPACIRVVNGSVSETTRLLECKWDHIFFTGSTSVGRVVAIAAAKHLTPCTLEVGKSPAFVDPKCNVQLAARKLLWGKIVNAGQTCVAPDYVLVPRSFQEPLVSALKATYRSFYTDDFKTLDDGVYSRLVSPQAFKRVDGLLKATKGTIVFGGNTDESRRYIEPTVVKDVMPEDSLMKEELFGPILPIVPVDDVDAGIRLVNAGDHPLVIYVFSDDSSFKKKVIENTQSGAIVVNEVMLHLESGIPFGGIGASGYGRHSFKYGFDEFTHMRGTMDQPAFVDKILSIRYPPYTPFKLKAVWAILSTKLPRRPSGPPPTLAKSNSAATWKRTPLSK